MKREDISIGLRVVPHSKSVSGYGDLDSSHCWQIVKGSESPYLYVIRIDHDVIVLDAIFDSWTGDYFLPEDFDPYIESKEKNKESGNVKMKKSELNSSMLFKMRDGKLYVLLPDHEEDLVFYDVDDINAGYSEGTVILYDLYDNLGHCDNDDYHIISIKQYDSCVEVLSKVLCNQEPKTWDWVEEVEKEESKVETTVQNITINVTIDSKMDINDFINELSSKLKNVSNY